MNILDDKGYYLEKRTCSSEGPKVGIVRLTFLFVPTRTSFGSTRPRTFSAPTAPGRRLPPPESSEASDPAISTCC